MLIGHVDAVCLLAGKTNVQDQEAGGITLTLTGKTNVQDQEAGGITQQIGATYFPMDKLKVMTDKLNSEPPIVRLQIVAPLRLLNRLRIFFQKKNAPENLTKVESYLYFRREGVMEFNCRRCDNVWPYRRP